MRLSLFLLIVTLPLATAQAQSNRGTVTGTVTDTDGNPLPGVQVVDRSLQRGTTAKANGQYRLSNLPPGTHTLEIRFVGYQTAVREVTLQAGETREVNVSLKARVLETEGVTVTGTARARSTLTTPLSVAVMGTEDLDANRSASLGSLLSENVAGVSSIQTGSQAGKPVLRGLSGNRIRVLKDGIGQEYYQFGVRHFPTTSSNEAERIEVVRGPSSIQYGSDALGGAINVITKNAPTADLGESRFGGNVRSQYFTNNNERAVGLDLQGARGSVGARVGFERRIADNYTAPDAPTFFDDNPATGTFGDPKYTGEIPFTNFEQWSGYAQVGTQGDFGTVQVYGDYWINRHNFLLPTGGPKGTDDNPPDGLGQNLEHGNLVAKGNLVADGFVLRPRLSFQTSIRQSGNGSGDQTLGFIEENGGFRDFDYPLDLKTDIYTGRLEVAHPKVRSVSGTLGAEVQFQDAQTRSGGLQPSADTWNAGLFVFEEVDWEPWTLNAGLRGDLRRIEAAPTPNTLAADTDNLRNEYTTLSGALGANVKVADGVALATNLSSGFRAPSVFELYASGVHGGVAAFQKGDPDLEPERAYSADVSVRVRRDRLTAEVTGYVNAINDYIYLENTPGETHNELPVFEADQTDAVIPGVEAKVEAQLQPWLHVGGQLAVLGGTGDDIDDGSDGDLPLLPANNATGFVHLTPDGQGPLHNPRVEVDLKHGFDKDAAGRFEPFSQFDRGFGPPYGTASTKAYTTVDASAESHLALGLGLEPSLRVAVRNVFDTAYRDFLDTYKGYALSPGRDVRLSLSVPF